MAILQFQDGQSTANLSEIREVLSGLGIELDSWPLPQTPGCHSLLQKAKLDDLEKETLLQALDERFSEQREKYGYQSRDLVVLHPEVPNLQALLAQFDKIHTHADDEVRYIVDGSGKFGFLRADGSQILLTVKAQDYIRVPKNTRHWFVLDEQKRIKAVRYFTNKEGWVANYTDDKVLL